MVPSAALNLAVQHVNISGGSLVIVWDTPLTSGGVPNSALSYSVYMRSSVETTRPVGSVVGVTRFNVSGLIFGVQYWFLVVSVNIKGAGPRSSEVSYIFAGIYCILAVHYLLTIICSTAKRTRSTCCFSKANYHKGSAFDWMDSLCSCRPL